MLYSAQNFPITQPYIPILPELDGASIDFPMQKPYTINSHLIILLGDYYG